MEQLKKGLESGTVLIQFEVREPEGPPHSRSPGAWVDCAGAAESAATLGAVLITEHRRGSEHRAVEQPRKQGMGTTARH